MVLRIETFNHYYQFSLFMHPDQAQNTLSASDSHSCHLRHCPHKFMQNNKIQMKHHSKNTTKSIHSKDSCSAVNSPHINTFWKHFHCQNSIPNCVWKHCFHTGKLCNALTTWDDTVSLGQPISVAYTENFHGRVSFSGVWWSFVAGVRFLWRHNLTSYSYFLLRQERA